MGIVLPVDLPTAIDDNEILRGINLPLSLPISLLSENIERQTANIRYKETVNLQEYHGQTKLCYKEKPYGKITKIPYREKVWFFPGLILSENVITELSAQLPLVENVQALILVDFELLSSNRLKLTWYGNNVPSFTIMKKSASETNYTADKTYGWSSAYAVVDIESEDYNIFLQGSSNSGSSAVYTIGGTNESTVKPKVEVSLNDKIYTATIEYTGEYRIEINY